MAHAAVFGMHSNTEGADVCGNGGDNELQDGMQVRDEKWVRDEKQVQEQERERDGEMGPRPNVAARARVRLKNGSKHECGNEHWGSKMRGRIISVRGSHVLDCASPVLCKTYENNEKTRNRMKDQNS